MLAVIIEFDILEGKEEEFREAWSEVTNYIYQNFGSLGSRLHKAKTGNFIAYAQWADKETYFSEHKWTEEGIRHSKRMRATYKSEAKVLQMLEMDIDLTRSETFE